MSGKICIDEIRGWKADSRGKLTMVTAYDALDAGIASAGGVEMLLVGDSIGTVKLGYADVKDVTPEDIRSHTAAVRRGAPDAFVISDVPYISIIKDIDGLLNDCLSFIGAGADAVKIESDLEGVSRVKHVINEGIPVVGHLGYTPQSEEKLGGAHVQGKEAQKALALLETALKLEGAGCFCIVCELIPRKVGGLITERVEIPVIGIGAGPDTDGQVLVLQDLLGFSGKNFKFLRKFGELGDAALAAVSEYVRSVKSGEFPSKKESFLIKTKEWRELKKIIDASEL